MDKPIGGIRREFSTQGFSEHQAHADPLVQFDEWFDEAVRSGMKDPTAMALATASADGVPAVRMVLLKGLSRPGLVFYTNYESRKGADLAANPRAAACLWWDEMDRQIRVEGAVERLSEEDSDAYFASRPREAQLGAWASQQSHVIADRAALEKRLKQAAGQHGDGVVPRPPHWGGFRIVPTMVEFWQGRPQRLHDRLRYTLGEDGQWRRERLAP